MESCCLGFYPSIERNVVFSMAATPSLPIQEPETQSIMSDPSAGKPVRGKNKAISPSRQFVIDLLHFAKQVPTLPMQRTMDLHKVIEAREAGFPRVSWCAIFLRAYGILASRHEELRTAYIPFPRPHFYIHPHSVASFSIERQYQGQPSVFFGQITEPEHRSLDSIDRTVRGLKDVPMDEIPSFRSAMLLSRIPAPFRRWVWWLGLCTDGMAKAHHFGTFGISVVASYGAASLTLLSPLTTTINYGVFQPDGTIDVRLMYDHRAMDGAFVARRMVELEEILRGLVTVELHEIASLRENSARWKAA
jgi:hypothetical protein